MIAAQKFLVVGVGLVVGAVAIAMVAEALLWAHVRAPAGQSGFYLLSPPTVAVSLADRSQPRLAGADDAWPRDAAGR